MIYKFKNPMTYETRYRWLLFCVENNSTCEDASRDFHLIDDKQFDFDDHVFNFDEEDLEFLDFLEAYEPKSKYDPDTFGVFTNDINGTTYNFGFLRACIEHNGTIVYAGPFNDSYHYFKPLKKIPKHGKNLFVKKDKNK